MYYNWMANSLHAEISGSHGGEYEQWNVAPCSLVEVDRRFIGAYCLHHQDIALMMEAVCTSETSVYFSETHTALYILEGYHIQRKLSIM
jgi:hypothetical protein